MCASGKRLHEAVMCCRLREDGQGEIDSVKAKIDEGGETQAGLEAELQSKDADIKTLQASYWASSAQQSLMPYITCLCTHFEMRVS